MTLPQGREKMQIANKQDVRRTSIAALEFILEAWDVGVEEGHDPDMLANAALFTALSGLVTTYGETAVVELVRKLPTRVLSGCSKLQAPSCLMFQAG
jgi:hypothetical protein